MPVVTSAVATNLFPLSAWEKYAVCYDSLCHLTPYMSMLRLVASHVHTGVQETLLDASCGTGNFEQVLLESPVNHLMSIVGVDSSKEMLARAHTKCAESACVNFCEANLNIPLAFGHKSFSQVVSINTLYAVEDPRFTLSEFFRVLKVGGKLLLVTPKAGCENGLILREHCKSQHPNSFWEFVHSSPEREEVLIREAIKEEHVIADMLTVARHNRNIGANCNFHFFSPEDLLLLLADVGFSVTQSSRTYADQALFIIATKP